MDVDYTYLKPLGPGTEIGLIPSVKPVFIFRIAALVEENPPEEPEKA